MVKIANNRSVNVANVRGATGIVYRTGDIGRIPLLIFVAPWQKLIRGLFRQLRTNIIGHELPIFGSCKFAVCAMNNSKWEAGPF